MYVSACYLQEPKLLTWCNEKPSLAKQVWFLSFIYIKADQLYFSLFIFFCFRV